jgi:hypothetical protein
VGTTALCENDAKTFPGRIDRVVVTLGSVADYFGRIGIIFKIAELSLRIFPCLTLESREIF